MKKAKKSAMQQANDAAEIVSQPPQHAPSHAAEVSASSTPCPHCGGAISAAPAHAPAQESGAMPFHKGRQK